MTQSHSPAPGSLRGLLRSGVGIAVATGVIRTSPPTRFTILAARGCSARPSTAPSPRLMFLLLVVGVLSLGLQATGRAEDRRRPRAARRDRGGGDVGVVPLRPRARRPLPGRSRRSSRWTARLDSWTPRADDRRSARCRSRSWAGSPASSRASDAGDRSPASTSALGLGRLVIGGALIAPGCPTAFGAMLGVALGAWSRRSSAARARATCGTRPHRGPPRCDPEQVLREVAAQLARAARVLRALRTSTCSSPAWSSTSTRPGSTRAG